MNTPTPAQVQQIARNVGGYPIKVRARQIWKFETEGLDQFAAAILEQYGAVARADKQGADLSAAMDVTE